MPQLRGVGREFFPATPTGARDLLKRLTGELLQFHEEPEALEYRQSLNAVAIKNLVNA